VICEDKVFFLDDPRKKEGIARWCEARLNLLQGEPEIHTQESQDTGKDQQRGICMLGADKNPANVRHTGGHCSKNIPISAGVNIASVIREEVPSSQYRQARQGCPASTHTPESQAFNFVMAVIETRGETAYLAIRLKIAV